MKKIIIAFLLSFATFAVFADTINTSAEVENFRNTKTNVNSRIVSIAAGTTVGSTYVDANFQGVRDSSTNQNTILTEARAKQTYALGNNVAVSLRGSVGKAFAPGTSFNFYTIQPGGAIAINDSVTATASVRYRNAFNRAVSFDTRTEYVGAEYKLNKNNIVGAQVYRQHKDVTGHGAVLSFSHAL